MSLNLRQQKILKLLSQKDEWTKGKELAEILKITSRTIRSDINGINCIEGEPLILSSKEGYKLIKNKAYTKYIKSDSVPISSIDRVYYILNKLLSHNELFDIYDIADEIFVSTSTLENDLKKLKEILENHKLSLEKKSNKICIKGNEKDKRRLFSTILYKETNNFLDLKNYQRFFSKFDLYEIKSITTDSFNKYHIYVNEYSIISLALHIAITLERIAHNCFLNDKEHNYIKLNNHKITESIVTTLEKKYDLKFPKLELCYLDFILNSRATLSYSDINMYNLKDFVDKYYIDLVDDILLKIKQVYHIDINGEEFFVKFVVHVQSMINRAEKKIYTKNPLNKSLKLTYPFIFDLSVFVANEIMKRTNIKIADDEIGYIAIHIGTVIEKNKLTTNKIKTAIVCPKYHDIHLTIIEKLRNKYCDFIEITNIITTIDYSIENLMEELVISITELNNIYDIPSVKINPFLTDSDYEKIDKQIKQINKQRHINVIKSYVINYFDKDLFFTDKQFEDEFEAIKFLGQKLLDKKLVNDDFIDSVIQREKLSSTCFENKFAIPHAIKMNSKKTVISVLITPKPILWKDSNINFILLIAINENDRKDFSKLYESLISILCNEKNVKLLIESSDCDEFIDCLTNLVYEN